jgi:hypothetical protein
MLDDKIDEDVGWFSSITVVVLVDDHTGLTKVVV